MFYVERQALLRAVGPDEMRGEPAHALVVAPRKIAHSGPLDLDDACTEVGELPCAERRRDRVLQRDDGDAFERAHRIKTRTSVGGRARARPRRPGSGSSTPAPPGRGASRGTCVRCRTRP